MNSPDQAHVHDEALGDLLDRRCAVCGVVCRWRVCFDCSVEPGDVFREAAATQVAAADPANGANGPGT